MQLGVSRPTVCYHARRLGIPPVTKFAGRYNWRAVQRYYDDEGHSIRACCASFGFSTQTWHEAVKRGDLISRPAGAPLTTYLVRGREVSRGHLKRRLLAADLKEDRCEECGIQEWQGKPLSLALHHVNGDGGDNRLENLQLLCPNCHSQTPNFSGRNVARGTAA